MMDSSLDIMIPIEPLELYKRSFQILTLRFLLDLLQINVIDN
jgi:hypothetical protein